MAEKSPIQTPFADAVCPAPKAGSSDWGDMWEEQVFSEGNKPETAGEMKSVQYARNVPGAPAGTTFSPMDIAGTGTTQGGRDLEKRHK